MKRLSEGPWASTPAYFTLGGRRMRGRPSFLYESCQPGSKRYKPSDMYRVPPAASAEQKVYLEEGGGASVSPGIATSCTCSPCFSAA